MFIIIEININYASVFVTSSNRDTEAFELKQFSQLSFALINKVVASINDLLSRDMGITQKH